jgi:hypothetical protein
MRLSKKQKSELLTTAQAATWLGWDIGLLIKMRSCATRGRDRRGPPYIKMDEDLMSTYYYHKQSLIKWASTRPIFLTASDVGVLLGIATSEVLKMSGLKNFAMKKGKLVIYPSRNLYVFIHKNKLKTTA